MCFAEAGQLSSCSTMMMADLADQAYILVWRVQK